MSESIYPDSDQLSIIPYDNNREVVLRHADSVVVFDPLSRQLILRNRNRDIDHTENDSTCPTCRRPYGDNDSSAIDDDLQDEQQPSFINNEYFRMLARSLPGSNRSSRPSSPHRQLAQTARSPLSNPPIVPPPDAEFVGSAPAPPDSSHGISESAFAPNYFERFFRKERELGRGGRGVVLLVRHVLDNVPLGQFACKRVPVGDDHAWLEKVLVEVQALQSLSHQNLVSYRHVWLQDYKTSEFAPSVPCAFILQQYCNGGDLHSYVCAPAQITSTTQDIKERIRRRSKGETELPRTRNEPRKLQFEEIRAFFLDITEGLRFLHLHGFIHRDLKPSNCLLHTVGQETRVLVSDFGEVQYENTIRKSTGHTGTISYCAPEVLKPVSPGGPLGNFTFKSDIFSLGMILHFLCFADLPYRNANVLQEEEEDLDELRAEISDWLGFDERRRDRPDLPGKLYAVLKHLLSLNPENRPSAEEVCNIVKLGNIDFGFEMKRRPSGGPSEELHPSKRITRLDSPAPGLNGRPGAKSAEIDPRTSVQRPRRRNGGLRSQSTESGVMPRENTTDDASDGTDQQDNDATYTTALTKRPSASKLLGDPPRLNTQFFAHVTGPSPPQSPQKQSMPSPERQEQFLLPAAPSARQPFGLRALLQVQISNLTVAVLLFVGKLMTALQPCLSYGINSNLFYLIFLLAAGDLALFPARMWRLVLMTMIHGGILWYAGQHGMWCRTGWLMASENDDVPQYR